jgi:hypothetical protein
MAQEQAPSAGARIEAVKYPWEPDGTIVANFAIGNLRESILKWLTTERGVHAETLMVVIGSLAGFSAQVAARHVLASMETPPKNAIVEATAGSEKYYFGDLINGHLVAQTGGTRYPLWSLVAAAAVEAGVPQAELPDVIDIFRHIAGSVGKPSFGVPRIPPNGHELGIPPRRALDLFWPHAKFLLSYKDGPGPAKGESVAVEHWPLVLALVAQQFVTMAKPTLDPRLSLNLLMESAIAMSKVDPETVPQDVPQSS